MTDKKARITKKDGYKCCPNGHTAETFPFGAEVSGVVAEWALADNAAKALFPRKRKKAHGAAPENKMQG